MKTGCIRYGYRRCADDFVAFDNKQHETVRTVRHNQTINFFWPPSRGPEKFFSLASLANTGPPITIFVIPTLLQQLSATYTRISWTVLTSED